MRRTAIAFLATMLLMTSARGARAEIGFRAETGNQPYLFATGMVLQRDAIVPVWGTALANASVRADFFDPASSSVLQSRSTTAGANGRWVVRFDHLPVGGPYEIRFYENDAATPVVLGDVLVGDVWLASGQSNMVIRLPKPEDVPVYTEVRSMAAMRWGQHAAGAAYYFGAELNDFLGIPIGIVNRAVPDTALGHWLPPETIDDPDPLVPPLFGGCGGDLINQCLYYEQSLRPLERPVEPGEPREGMALRGVVWWQGEKGVDRRGTAAYGRLFPAMMRAWRANLGQPNLPFVFHGLPSGTGLRWDSTRVRTLPKNNRLDDWQGQQHAMFFRMLAFPRTSIMTSTDLVGGIHPKDFEAYGRRLGDAALGTTYGGAGPDPYSGPIYESATREAVQGGPDQIRLRFRAHTADGLVAGPSSAPEGAPLQGFALCCDSGGGFVFADARIENGDEVVVSDAAVPAPSVVNYAIGHTPSWANLFNGAGLGAAPFSTALAPFADQDPDGDGFWEPGPYVDAP